ncbi:MAG: VWA-like domain-containing protein [Polyangiaceae bacterium]
MKPKEPTIANRPEQQGTSAIRQLYADPAAAAAQAADKIAAARVWLLKEKPFFGVLSRALTIEATLQVPAFRLTANDHLRVNPLIVLELKFPALCARMAHLALHAALGAFTRRGPREERRWNAAHDLAVEPLLRAASMGSQTALVDAGIDLPPGASADEYYALLPEGARPDDLWCDLSDPPSNIAPPPAGQFTRQDDGEGDDPGDNDPKKKNDSPGDAKDPDRPPDDNPADDDANDDDGEDEESDDDTPLLPEPSPLETRSRELQWKMRLAAALEEELASGGKTFGSTPAWIDEMVRATIEPPPDWAAELQRSVAMLARQDRSFLRPSRRMSALVGATGEWPDVVAMPGRRVVAAGRLVAVIDTSASIDTQVVSRFFGAVASVATAEGFDEVRVVQADAEVTRDEVISAAELLFQEVAITGRGGTDFGPALRMLAAESRREAERFTVVYLTDGEGRYPFPGEISPLSVVWVIPGTPRKTPLFGRVLEMR